VGEDVIVLPCRGVFGQGAVAVAGVNSDVHGVWMRAMVVVAPLGSRPAE